MRQTKIDQPIIMNFFRANRDVFLSEGPVFSRNQGAGLFMGFQADALHFEDKDVILVAGIEQTISGISQLYYISFKQLFAEGKPKNMSEDDFTWLRNQSKRLLVPYQVMIFCECRPSYWAMIKFDTF
ncbi:MAG: hypothetical protein Crog4KO_34880 [Crocinitomicaceae bacterium]